MLIFGTMSESAAKHKPIADENCEQLLGRMARGELAALEELYAGTKTAVYGFALSILKHPQDAEDVMQETYIRLYSAASGYLPQGKPMAWILTIVRNLSLQKLKGRQADPNPADEDRELADPRDFAEQSTEKLLLTAAMTRLSEEERQVVLLHSLSGLKHRETAKLLGLPLPTVLSKYHRALSKLKKIIEEET